MKKDDFLRWFNRDFWKAFSQNKFPIALPKTPSDKAALLDSLYLEIITSCYVPNPPEAELIINKGHGIARTVPVFSIKDYCVYYFCIKELEEVLCINRTPNTFGGWSLGGSLRKLEDHEIEEDTSSYGRYSFNPHAWTQAFGQFNSLLFSQLDSGTNNYVLQLDLSNFYDCVRLDILERWIREQANSEKSEIITLLFFFLNHWNRRNTGLHPQTVGLPQDALADCSRILSNFYLQKYDQFAYEICKQVGGSYFRYADDQMLLLNDTSKVENILLLLTRNLDRYGLRLNQLKVRLWETAELYAYRCRDIQAIFSSSEDKKNPLLVQKYVDAYLAMTTEQLSHSWNSGMPLLNRLLGASLESLPKKQFNQLLIRMTETRFLLQASAKQLVQVTHLNSLQTIPIDINKQIVDIAQKSVHNSFHYEAKAYASSVKSFELVKYFEERIEIINELIAQNKIE